MCQIPGGGSKKHEPQKHESRLKSPESPLHITTYIPYNRKRSPYPEFRFFSIDTIRVFSLSLQEGLFVEPRGQQPRKFAYHLNQMLDDRDIHGQIGKLRDILNQAGSIKSHALLRNTRRYLNSWATDTRGGIEHPSKYRKLIKTKIHDHLHDMTFFSLLAHRVGYLRQIATEELVDIKGKTALNGLYFSADDHVRSIRECAARALDLRSPEELASVPYPLTTPAPDADRAGWRHSILQRISESDEAKATLHRIALDEDGENACAALTLLKRINPDNLTTSEFIKSRNWRIRVEFAKASVKQGDLSDFKDLLLEDPCIMVRHAIVTESSWLPPHDRDEVMRLAIKDKSRRIRGIAAYYVRESKEVSDYYLKQYRDGHPTQQARALETLVFLAYPGIEGLLEESLKSEYISLRRVALRGFYEIKKLSKAHLDLMAEDSSRSLIGKAAVYACKSGRISSLDVLSFLEKTGFADSPEVLSILHALDVWDALPYLMKAVFNQWPKTEDYLESYSQRFWFIYVNGWLKPSPNQRGTIITALNRYSEKLPPSFVSRVKQVIDY